MDDTTVRISNIEIENVENIEHGYLRLKNPDKLTIPKSSGQGEVEKALLADTIELLKIILSGKPAPSYFADCISMDKSYAIIKYEFEVQDNSDSSTCYVLYKVSLHRNSSSSAILDETLSYSREHDDLASAKGYETVSSHAVSHSSIFSDRFTDELKQNLADNRCRFVTESLKEFGRRELGVVSTVNADMLLIPSERL